MKQKSGLIGLLLLFKIFSLITSTYLIYDLEELCMGEEKEPMILFVQSDPLILKADSFKQDVNDCHLKVKPSSEELGFLVFVEQLILESNNVCTKDSILFNR